MMGNAKIMALGMVLVFSIIQMGKNLWVFFTKIWLAVRERTTRWIER
jgi:hypothetical protein